MIAYTRCRCADCGMPLLIPSVQFNPWEIGAETFVQTMRNNLFDHILRLPFKWHSENRTGDIIQRCTSDVEQIKMFLIGTAVMPDQSIRADPSGPVVFMSRISGRGQHSRLRFIPDDHRLQFLFPQ